MDEEDEIVCMWQELQDAGYYDRLLPVLKLLLQTEECEVRFVTVSEAAALMFLA